MTTPRPSLERLIDEAAKLPPGPQAWAPIFRHYPELTRTALARNFSIGRGAINKKQQTNCGSIRVTGGPRPTGDHGHPRTVP
jgi:hypothetical protein